MSQHAVRGVQSEHIVGSSTIGSDGVEVPIVPRTRTRRLMSDVSYGPGLLEMVSGEGTEDEEKDRLEARSSSIIKFYPDWCRCRCCRSQEPVGADAPFKDQVRSFFQCPPHGTFGRLLLCSMIVVFLWGLLFYLFKPLTHHVPGKVPKYYGNPAWVNGPLFALGLIEITGLIFGILLKRFLNLPPLLGPLILGILYNNVKQINVFILMTDFDHRDCSSTDTACLRAAEHSLNNWVKPIRIIALGIILTRAGLELSPKQLSKLKGVVPLLAFAPCVMEAVTCAVSSFVFFNVMEPNNRLKMGWAMCFVGGFALAAVSPAVVVPGALSLKKSGYGVVKGVPTLLIAASSIDDVLAISVYTIALGFAIEKGGSGSGSPKQNDWKKFSGGFIGIVAGTIHGVIVGIILHFLPPRNSRYKAENRLLLLLLINFTSVLAYEETFYNGAGSISVLVTSFIAGFGWRSQPHWKRPMKKIEKTLAHMWVLWVPLIFGTIGKEIDFKATPFKPPTIFKIFGVMGISLVIRCTTAFLAVGFGTNFNYRERLFIALSWIPKATVQAALAPLVLTRATEEEIAYPTKTALRYVRENAEIVVCLAILAILVTAPVGCVLIALTGPKLLQRNSSPEIHQEVESEFPNGEGLDPIDSTFELVSDVRRSLLKNEQELREAITSDSNFHENQGRTGSKELPSGEPSKA